MSNYITTWSDHTTPYLEDSLKKEDINWNSINTEPITISVPLDNHVGMLQTILFKYIKKPEIERVIFNKPATIIYWKDGTKTVVKCMEEDSYAPDVGMAMCFMKKLFEEDDVTYMKKGKEETAYGYKKVFKKWIDGYGKD